MDALTVENEVLDTGEESFLLVYLCLLGSFLYFLWLRKDETNYKDIPTVGFSGTVTSFISALRWLHDQAGVVRKGNSLFPNGIFRYPTLMRWMVVVTQSKYVEELRKAPEDEVSASEAMKELLGISSAIDSELFADREHKALLGAQLTRKLHDSLPNVDSLVSEVMSKLVSACDDWNYIDEVDIVTRICIRTINDVLTGVHLHPELVDQLVIFSQRFDQDVKKLKRFPEFLRPLYLSLFTPLPRIKRSLRVLLVAILKERHEIPDDHGHTLPNDMITWLTSRDVGSETLVDELVSHVLLVNYLAVRPMVQVMSQAFRNLALHPDCIAPLRKEIEEATRYGGWIKASIDKMHKLDSFLKETMRLSVGGLSPDFPTLTMPRKCLRSMTFSDGTTVPQGALLFVGSQLLHTDTRHYSQPESFDPFRFIPSQVNENEPLPMSRSYHHSDEFSSCTFLPVSLTLPATSSTFLAWGHGKHACPGRFLAALVMKLVLGRFVYEFDIRPPEVGSTDNILWIEVRKWQRQVGPCS